MLYQWHIYDFIGAISCLADNAFTGRTQNRAFLASPIAKLIFVPVYPKIICHCYIKFNKKNRALNNKIDRWADHPNITVSIWDRSHQTGNDWGFLYTILPRQNTLNKIWIFLQIFVNFVLSLMKVMFLKWIPRQMVTTIWWLEGTKSLRTREHSTRWIKSSVQTNRSRPTALRHRQQRHLANWINEREKGAIRAKFNRQMATTERIWRHKTGRTTRNMEEQRRRINTRSWKGARITKNRKQNSSEVCISVFF